MNRHELEPQRTGQGEAKGPSGWGTKALLLGAAGVGAWLAWKAWKKVNEYDLRGKNVLVTGGSRGLGLVLARELARQGANLIICARDRAELARAFEDLDRRGVRVLALHCDVSDPEHVQAAVNCAVERWGHVDVLVNNAGIITVGPEPTMTVKDYQEAMAINFWGPLHMIRAVLPGMRQRGEGRIVNITSIGGKVSIPHLLPYSASKFALVGLSEGLRAELAREGIVVTTICPGLMRTGSPRNAVFKGKHDEEYTWFSISDSLPGLSISAESAARQIVTACRRGDAEVVLSLPAKLGAWFHGLFPGLTANLLSYVNRMLPSVGGEGQAAVKGKDCSSALSPSWLTSLSEKAARLNNEVPPEEESEARPKNRINWGEPPREKKENEG